MTTHKDRILKVIQGELVDRIPWVPRLDLWHNANVRAETLPQRHKGKTADEIALSEGWALHKMVPEFEKGDKDDIKHRGLGLYNLKEYLFDFEFPPDVDIEVSEEVSNEEDMLRVVYRTPAGMVESLHGYTAEMKASGASISWIKEHVIKGPEDYRTLAHIFGNLKLKPKYEPYIAWQNEIGENGVAVPVNCAIACSSPMHYIQKTFLGATEFYLHYEDHTKEMAMLGEALEHFYNRLLDIVAESPCEIVLWSANVDEMVTHPPYFKKEILPWVKKAADTLHAKGKFVMMHPDGENQGLMDLIPQTGVDIAEAVTPFPMTKVKLDEYYDRWCRSDKLTIWGGVPESLLLHKSTTDEEFEAYLDNLFKAIAPGKRFILGIGDTTPPAADFERLVRIGERIEKEGRLPLEAGAFNPLSHEQLTKSRDAIASAGVSVPGEALEIMAGMIGRLIDSSAAISRVLADLSADFDRLAKLGKTGASESFRNTSETTAGLTSLTAPVAFDEPELEPEGPFETIKQHVLSGKSDRLKSAIQEMLDLEHNPEDILNKGMLSAMEIIGGRFKDGTVFIPEVLKSARAMNEAMHVLEPHLQGEKMENPGKILIGTVRGDLHDIGKNMVISMLRGVGFELVDLGINVAVDEFVERVKEHRPDILGMSALLTTTMPQMEEVIKALKEAGLREGVKIIVGGAPVNQKFADDIGSDSYAADAGDAVSQVKMLLMK